MPRTYGSEFPERPLMSVLSDLIGIDHFTTARGSSVRRDFLEAVGTGIGLAPGSLTAMSTKDDVLTAVLERATRRPMRADLVSVGGTVTNKALQAIVDGLNEHGVPGKPRVQVPAEEPVSEQVPDFDPL